MNAATLSMSTTQAQWDLAGLGYLPFAGVDGAVGPQTQNSTRAFQSDACLAVEGIVRANTSAALVGKVMKVQSVVGVAQDGGFGPATEQALKHWQVAHQLPADGQAGSQTMSRMGLVRSTCSAPPPAPSPVPPAQSSTAQAQWDLAGLGYLSFADVDGIAGPRTAAAAQSFQADRCLGVDGIIGPITMSALAAQVTKVQAVAGTARDGGFGPNTRAAVTSWQLARSVAPADGQAGSVTMGAMNIARTAPCSSPPPPPPNGNLGAAIASVATAELNNSLHNHEVGGYNCNYYSAVLGVGGTGCSNGWRTEEWCADFGTWVWRQAGAISGGLTPAAASFFSYGRQHGTWHISNPQVGDAVVFDLNSSDTFASHVGLVTAVSGATVTMISGNSISPSTGQIDAVSSVNMSSSGGGISEYATPLSATPLPPPGTPGHSTNYDWANVVLQDGGWPVSTNNVTVITQWMDSEEPSSTWWTATTR